MWKRACIAVLLTLAPALAGAETLILKWEDLVPADGSGVALSLPSGVVQHGTLLPSDLQARSPFSDAYRGALDDPKSLQPQGSNIRAELDGKTVRIAGFVTPLGYDGVEVTEFLLVPYVGACIHVPPPPANQIVMVSKAEGFDLDSLYDAVWVEGVLKAIPVSTGLADVGYQMVGARVRPYE